MKPIPRLLVAGIAAAATLTALVACSAPGEDDASSSITIAGGVGFEANPFKGGHLFFTAAQAVYDPIVMVEAEGVDPEPWLAESWDIAEDGTSITFHLREDIDFVDGTHMDAPGLAEYFTALFDTEAYTWKARVVDQAGATVEATGEYDLTFTFSKEPIGFAWLWQFSLTPVASPATVGVEGAFDDGPVGTGPYTIEDSVTDVSLNLVRRDGYFNPDAYPYDEIEILQYEDQVAALNALKSGQIDAASITLQQADEAESSGFRINTGAGEVPMIYIDDHNGKLDPAWADIRVRQAIAYAFDREGINEALYQGYGLVSSQPFSEGQPEYVEGADDDYAYDLDRAKELLAEAGYPDGLGKAITIPTLTGTTDALEPVVQQTLSDLGITVTYEPYTDIYELIAVWNEGKYPIYLFPMAATNWVVAFDEFWGGRNVGIENPRGFQPEDTEWIALVTAYRQTNLGDPDALEAAAQDIGQYLNEQVWYVPFAKPFAVFASTEDVEVEIPGFYPRPNLFQYRPAD
jgi:peptide/nickel transport system substrate-binding protein